jgi:multimeric flavodoxin WrbA
MLFMISPNDFIQELIIDKSPTSQVLGIGGSPRKGGNSDILLQYIIKGVTENETNATSLHLRDFDYQGCLGCEMCRKDKICTRLKDGMSLIYPQIIESRGLVLVCPTHNYNITAWMKAFIDRLYCFYDFDNSRPRRWSSRLAGQGRKAVLAAICEQENTEDMGFTLDAMRLPLKALGFVIIGELPVFRIFDKAKVKQEKLILDKAIKLGSDLAKSIQR